MKNKFLKKIITTNLLALSMITMLPICANAAWKSDKNGWWYTEGSSYVKGQWKQIGQETYYFYNDGYMAHDTIVDGCYVNSKGERTVKNMPKEVSAYLTKIHDLGNEVNDIQTVLIDINKDGVKELVLFYEKKGAGLAGFTGAVATYYNGNVILEEIAHHGGIYGYDSSKNAIFGVGGNQGYLTYDGYVLENGEFKKQYSYSDGLNALRNDCCEINGNKVTESYYKQVMNQINTKVIKFN